MKILSILKKEPEEHTPRTRVKKYLNAIENPIDKKSLKEKITEARKNQNFREPENENIKKLVDIGINQLQKMELSDVNILSALMGVGTYKLNNILRTRGCLNDGLGCTADLDSQGYASYQKFKDNIDYLFFTTSDTGLSPKDQWSEPDTLLVYRGIAFNLPDESLNNPQKFVEDKLGINHKCYIEPGISFATPFINQANSHPAYDWYISDHYTKDYKNHQRVTLKIHAHSFISLPESSYLPHDILDLVSITTYANTDFNIIFPSNSHFHIHNIFTVGNHTEIDITQK